MPNKCVFAEGVEFEPIVDGNLHFSIVTGDEKMRFCIARSTVRKVASKATRMLDAADREQCVFVALAKEGHQAASAL